MSYILVRVQLIDGGFFSSEEKTNNRIILVFGVYRATISYFNIWFILVARLFLIPSPLCGIGMFF